VNGRVQNASSLAVPDGSVVFQLNIDATVIVAPYGFVAADIPIVFQFDSNGDILPNSPAVAAQIYSNMELNPQNDEGLGTYYLVTFYDANGARINRQPMWWQFTEVAGSTVDIGFITPYATVGGNVIYYPSVLQVPTPTITTLGGVFSNAGSAHEWIRAINTNGSVSISQPAFSDLSGQITSAQIPSGLTFAATTFSGLITAQANIQLGVSGTTAGQITLEGSTSGASTITAPAVAGTVANPVSFSNGINIPAGAVYSINSDSGLSRVAAGVIAVGNGSAADFSGTIQATILKGGFQDAVQTASTNADALVYPGSVFITYAGVDNTTLATPTATADDGKVVTVFDTGGHAHTITCSSNKIVPSHHLVTFNGTAGSWVTLEAYQGLWYPRGSSGVTIS
jgi:hypothetical protein